MSKDTIMQRVASWTADFEDSNLLLETMLEQEVDAHLLDEAYNIMCDIYTENVNKIGIDAALDSVSQDAWGGYEPDSYTTGPLHRP